MNYPKTVALILVLAFCSSLWPAGDINNLPANTWVRIASSPGDEIGREVPPGRGSNWVYEPGSKVFLRYGGYTPGFSNALEEFDPATLTWKKLFPYDQTYPSNRPGGGANWGMAYDSARKMVLIMGGWRSRDQKNMPYAIGSQGIWKYDPLTKLFTRVGDSLPWNTYHTFDPVNNVIVASPFSAYSYSRKTYVFSLSANRWEVRTTNPTPQSTWSGSYPAIYDPSIERVVLFKGAETWTYDAAANLWDSLTTIGVPSSTLYAAYAYDPGNRVIVRFGGSNGKVASTQINETWIYKASTKTWTQLMAPGIPMLSKALFYYTMAYDPQHHCLLLNEPDLGVWAFKYDPLQPAGTGTVGAETLIVGRAAANPPASGPAEVLLQYNSPLNQRLLGLPDKTLLPISGTTSVGAEIMWDVDPDLGVIVKYGGCTNNASSPYWTGYGNQLDIYDIGTESWVPRRVCDVGGCARPMAGCTRSNFYDSKRKCWWMLGVAAGGPWPPAPPTAVGPYSYDVRTDRFTDHKVVPVFNPNDGGVNVGTAMSYDPDHDISVVPASGKIYVFHPGTAQWEIRTVTGGPGRLGTYVRTVYASVPKVFICIMDSTTWAYDPAQNKWTDLNAANQPPSRGCKYGLAYDSRNNVVLMVGGMVSYGVGPFNDMWIYRVSDNTWENVTQSGTGSEIMLTTYDARHNVFLLGGPFSTLYAYRYKKDPAMAEDRISKEKASRLMVSPNPFRQVTRIRFTAASGKSTSLKVYDLKGRKIADLANGKVGAHLLELDWNSGQLPSGIYILKARAGKEIVSRRVFVKR